MVNGTFKTLSVLGKWRLEEDSNKYKVIGYSNFLKEDIVLTSKIKNSEVEDDNTLSKRFLTDILNTPMAFDLLNKSYLKMLKLEIVEISNRSRRLLEETKKLLSNICNCNLNLRSFNNYDEMSYYLKNKKNNNYELFDLSKTSKLLSFFELHNENGNLLAQFSLDNILNLDEKLSTMCLIYYYYDIMFLLDEIKEILSKEDNLRYEIDKLQRYAL